jgi:hypothetical protein
MDILTTYTHKSELEVITALSLIYTLYKSLHAKYSPACSAFSRCLVTALNNGDSSASVLTPLLFGEYQANWTFNWTVAPSLLSLPCRTQLSTDWVAPIIFLVTPLHGPDKKNTVSNSNSIVACVLVAAETSLQIHCLETGCITLLFIRLFRLHCIATSVHATMLHIKEFPVEISMNYKIIGFLSEIRSANYVL